VIYLLAFLMNITTGLLNLANPLVALERFGADPLMLGVLGTAPALVYALGCASSGLWARRFGSRILITTTCLLLIPVFASIFLVRHLSQLLILAAAASACGSIFWPAMIRWLGEPGGGGQLGRRVGNYNIALISGVMAGPLLGGQLIGLDYRWPYLLAGFLALIVLVFLVATHPRPGRRVPSLRPEPEDESGVVPVFVYLAWTANFAAFFAIGICQSLFPALGKGLPVPLSDGFLGFLVSLLAGGEVLIFLVLRRSTRWHYCYLPLAAAELLAVAGLLTLAAAAGDALFTLGFLAVGLAGGMTYFSSIYYSIHRRERAGQRSGFHESFLGLGVALGPIAGGLVAQWWGLRAPYLLGAVVFLAVICLQAGLLWGWKARKARAG